MKACPQCGAEYEDFMSFCMKDGTPLVGGDDSAETESTASEPIPPPPQTDEIQSVEPTGMETEQFSAGDTANEVYDEQETVIRKRVEIPTAPVNEETATGQSQAASAGGQQIKSSTEKKSNLGIIAAVLLLGGLLFLGAIAAGGLWWYMSSGDEIAVTNANTNENTSDLFEDLEDDNSNETSNDNTSENTNEDKSPTPTPTKSPSPSPTKTPSPSPTETPSPSPSATTTPTSTPNNNPTTPTPTQTPQTTPTPRGTPRTIAGGIVNGKARRLPKPAYPASARAVGARGGVNVRVLIDERGNVVSARAVSGHPLLRGPAASAARRAKFNPTTLSGQPVKVSGIITYVFNY